MIKNLLFSKSISQNLNILLVLNPDKMLWTAPKKMLPCISTMAAFLRNKTRKALQWNNNFSLSYTVTVLVPLKIPWTKFRDSRKETKEINKTNINFQWKSENSFQILLELVLDFCKFFAISSQLHAFKHVPGTINWLKIMPIFV